MPYQLVKQHLSHDVIEALEQLLEGARRGEITGIVFAATLRQQRFITDVAGLCYKNVVFTRGMVATLDDELAAIVAQRDPSETR